MKALTERDLREELGWKQVESYTIEPGTLVTPSARQFLNERKIELIVKEKQGAELGPEPDSKPMAEGTGRKETEEPAPFKPRFVGPDGGMFAVKPEHLTHLHSNVLVTKGHPRIAFRGKMDSLQAGILEVQGLAAEAYGQGITPFGPHFNRYLIGSATHTTALHLDLGPHVFHGILKDRKRLLVGHLALDDVHGVVEQPARHRLLALAHQTVGKLGNKHRIKTWVRSNGAPVQYLLSWHDPTFYRKILFWPLCAVLGATPMAIADV